jgi:hypothetical protein
MLLPNIFREDDKKTLKRNFSKKKEEPVTFVNLLGCYLTNVTGTKKMTMSFAPILLN